MGINAEYMGQFTSLHSTMKFLVVFSVLAVSAHSAPQLLYNGYAGLAGLPYYHTAVHAVPTVAKKTLTYKTAAFEPVEADTPADAKLISLKETEHSYDVLVPGPVKYVTSPVAYAHHAYGYAGLPYYGLPVAAAPAAEEEAAEE